MLIVPPHRKPVNSGTDDQEIHTRTHLGNIIQCGDYVLGFDVAHAVVNNQVFDKIKQVPRGGLFCSNLCFTVQYGVAVCELVAHLFPTNEVFNSVSTMS